MSRDDITDVGAFRGAVMRSVWVCIELYSYRTPEVSTVHDGHDEAEVSVELNLRA